MNQQAGDRAEEERLTADLMEMGRLAHEAEFFLGELATSLFDDGGDLKRLTWAENPTDGTAAEPASPEAQLRAAEARYRSLVEQIPAVTFMAVLGQGKNEVYVSPHIEAMLGFTQQEWLENPFLWYRQLHPDDRQKWNDEFGRGCRTGGPFKAECRFIARDGRVVWVLGEARLVRDELDRPLVLQGIAFDITENKKAQEVLLQETLRHARAEEELAIARRVQTSLLPKATLIDGLEIAATMIPAEQVGGDYYDVLPARDGCWIAVGDVSDHGLNAGLVMMMVQSAISALTRAGQTDSPREVLITLNQVIYDNVRNRLLQDDHMTLSLFRFFRDGRMTFAGAHEEISILRAQTGVLELVATPGSWIGGQREIGHATRDHELKLHDGDLMVLHTDGITEATNVDRQQFDIQGLSSAIKDIGAGSVEGIRDHVIQKVQDWMSVQFDDISLVVLKYRAPSRSGEMP